jgi:hypothetical protein
MNNYQPLSIVSKNLQTTEEDLLRFQQHNWIQTVEKNGLVFVSGRDAYKAKFILHLRRLRLSDEEIGIVLEERNPPYSLADVPKILGRPLAIR